MKTKVKHITACIGSVDIFTKISLVRTLIMSKPLHCFRVYPPSKDILDSMWDIFKKSLWSKSFLDKTFRRTKVAAKRLTVPVQNGGLGILHIQTTAALSMLSSSVSILSHAVSDNLSIFTPILHSDPVKHNTAVRFLNSHFFNSFWTQKIKRFFPQSSHLIEHLQSLFMETELDGFYGLFMPVLNHRLLDAKVKFLAIFKPSDFEYGGPLFDFPNILSLMHICQRGRKKFICPNVCNPKIDLLRNETHKKFLKELHSNVISKVNFTPNNFALRNRNLTFFELVAKYSVHFLTGALKKSARKISGRNAPPPSFMAFETKRPADFPSPRTLSKFLAIFCSKKDPSFASLFSL